MRRTALSILQWMYIYVCIHIDINAWISNFVLVSERVKMQKPESYQLIQEYPNYQPISPVRLDYDENSQVSPFQPRTSMDIHHTDLSRTQVSAFCMICAVYNFICCPRLGIPALIFAILGKEAEKRRDIEAAKSHAYHAKIFNIISSILNLIYLLITGLIIAGILVLLILVYYAYQVLV